MVLVRLFDGFEEGFVREVLRHGAVAHIAVADTDQLADVLLVGLRPKLLRLHLSFLLHNVEIGKGANFIERGTCPLLLFRKVNRQTNDEYGNQDSQGHQSYDGTARPIREFEKNTEIQ